MSAHLEALAELTAALTCAQCGLTYDQRACGPSHAILSADITRHRLIAPLLERERAAVAARVDAVCVEWDILTHGESPTTARIRAALAGVPA